MWDYVSWKIEILEYSSSKQKIWTETLDGLFLKRKNFCNSIRENKVKESESEFNVLYQTSSAKHKAVKVLDLAISWNSVIQKFKDSLHIFFS